jgi:limonene-1,2-epoxide hydrolase
MQRVIEKEILDLEKRFWKTMQDKDIDAALQLTDDPCIVTGAQGVARIDKQTLAKLMTNSTWKLHDFDIKEVQVQPLSNDVVVIG